MQGFCLTSSTAQHRPVGARIPQNFAAISNNKSTISRQIASKSPSLHPHQSISRPIMTHASSSSDLGIESVGGIRPEVDAAIQAALDNCLTETDLGNGTKYRVRMLCPILSLKSMINNNHRLPISSYLFIIYSYCRAKCVTHMTLTTNSSSSPQTDNPPSTAISLQFLGRAKC